MGQKERSQYYQYAKSRGYEFEKKFNQYSEDELALIAQGLVEQEQVPTPPVPPVELPPSVRPPKETAPEPPAPQVSVPRSNVNEDVYAGMRLNTKAEDEVIRVDDRGRQWLQEEVAKPAYAKPRARRVTRYMDPGTETRQVGGGGQFESFEVAGKLERPAEIKTTLPTFQTGIYKHPSHPFRVHTYNGREGYNLFDVRNYFGGSELVPEDIKHVYVSNDLCYDIRSTKRAIETIFREMQLHKKGYVK